MPAAGGSGVKMPKRVRNYAPARIRRSVQRQRIQAIRDATACAHCGGQPIEWHNPEHVDQPHRRISKMVGRAWSRIEEEIACCTPLCRSCHMTEDGRLVALQAARPRQRGGVYTDPRPCTECGRLYKPLRKGLCANCYMRHRR